MLNPKAFSRACRLLKSSDFSRVLSKGDRRICRYCKVFVVPNTSGHARLGLIVSKKALKHAIWRNRFKRLQREKFRLMQSQLPGVDVVLVAKWRLADLKGALDHGHFADVWQTCLELSR